MPGQAPIQRLALLVTNPRQYWEEEVDAPGDLKSLLVPQMLVLAALPGVAVFLSTLLRGLFRGQYIAGPLVALLSAVMVVAFCLVVWIALGHVIDHLAHLFDAQRELNQSMKLASAAVIPMWLGFLPNIIPHNVGYILGSVGSLAGLGYGCYLLYLGLPMMNGTPQDRAATYTMAAMAILFALFSFFMGLAMCTGSCLMGSAAGTIH